MTAKTRTRIVSVLDRIADLCTSILWMDLGVGVFAFTHDHRHVPTGLVVLLGILAVVWVASSFGATLANSRTVPTEEAQP